MRPIKFYAIQLFAGCLVFLKWALFAFQRIFTVLRNNKLGFFTKIITQIKMDYQFVGIQQPSFIDIFINNISKSRYPRKRKNTMYIIIKNNMRIAKICIRLLCFIETNNNCNMERDIFLFHYWVLIFNIHIPIHYPKWPSFYWKKPPLNTDCVFFIQSAHSNRFASLPWIIHLIMQSKSRLVYSKTSLYFLRTIQSRIIRNELHKTQIQKFMFNNL